MSGSKGYGTRVERRCSIPRIEQARLRPGPRGSTLARRSFGTLDPSVSCSSTGTDCPAPPGYAVGGLASPKHEGPTTRWEWLSQPSTMGCSVRFLRPYRGMDNAQTDRIHDVSDVCADPRHTAGEWGPSKCCHADAPTTRRAHGAESRPTPTVGIRATSFPDGGKPPTAGNPPSWGTAPPGRTTKSAPETLVSGADAAGNPKLGAGLPPPRPRPARREKWKKL